MTDTVRHHSGTNTPNMNTGLRIDAIHAVSHATEDLVWARLENDDDTQELAALDDAIKDALDAWCKDVADSRAAGYAEAVGRECVWKMADDEMEDDGFGQAEMSCRKAEGHDDRWESTYRHDHPRWCGWCGGKVRIEQREAM